MRKVSLVTLAAAALTLFLIPVAASASIITIGADQEFSGGAAPLGPTPWVTTTFEDTAVGVVRLTFAATNLVNNEFVSNCYINLDPALDPTLLVFSAPTTVGNFTLPAISQSANTYKADGDGFFDVNFAFATNDGLPTRFTAGDSISYDITMPSNPTFGAESFNAMSSHGGGAGQWPMAAHVQGIDAGTGSGWVSGPVTPEPATLSLVALGGLAMLRRRK